MMDSFYKSAINTSVKRKALIEFAFYVYGNPSAKNVFKLFREDNEFNNSNNKGFLNKVSTFDARAFQGDFFTKLGFAAAGVTVLSKSNAVGTFAFKAYGYHRDLFKYFLHGWNDSFGKKEEDKLNFLERLIKAGDNFLKTKLKVTNPHITIKWIHIGVFLALFLTLVSKVGFKKIVTAFWKAVKTGVNALISFAKWFFNWVKDTIFGLTNVKKQFGNEEE